jgi:anti-sigma B factor antagonist
VATRTSIVKGDIAVVDIHGNLVGGEETTVFQQAVMELLDQQYRKLVLDLKDVPYINSTGLGVLIGAHTSSVRRGCQLVVCNLNNSVSSLLVITGLNIILNVKGTREEAVTSLVQ